MRVQSTQDFDGVRPIDVEHEERVATYRQRSQVGKVEFDALPRGSDSGKASELARRASSASMNARATASSPSFR